MARTRRQLSVTGIYHVMLRGNNREEIFGTENDVKVFLKILGSLCPKYGFKLYAYCFMVNHVHLLLRENESGAISTFMKRLKLRYTNWYQRAHGRTGTIFGGRFKSQAVETDEYFKTVLKYIHNNPVKAGMCGTAREYVDSSFKHFVGAEPWIIDREFVFELIPEQSFELFHLQLLPAPPDQPVFLEMPPRTRPKVVDELALDIMRTISVCTSGAELLAMDMGQVISTLRKFRKQGLTLKQIAGFLMRGKSTVWKWTKFQKSPS